MPDYFPEDIEELLPWLENFIEIASLTDHRKTFALNEDKFTESLQVKKLLLDVREVEKFAQDSQSQAEHRVKEAQATLKAAERQLADSREAYTKAIDNKGKARYEAVRRIRPLTEYLRTHGKMYPDLAKEMGIGGEGPIERFVLYPPANLTVVKVDSGSLLLTWDTNGNNSDTNYEIEVAIGGLYRGDPVAPASSPKPLSAVTGIGQYQHRLPPGIQSGVPIVYRVGSRREGKFGGYSNDVSVFR